jgi:hypothetical protein
MNAVNLIPIHRRRARARRTRLRAWIILNSLVLIALLGGGAVTYMLLASDHSPTADLARVKQDIEQSNKQLLIVRQQFAEAQQTMTSVKAISDQPDWSVLMAVVAKSLGDEVVLNRCELAPVKEEVQPINMVTKKDVSQTPASRRVLLHLSGVGHSQGQVAQFVLRLEATDLFEHVNLLHTTRQVLMGGEAVGFELDCPLAGRIGGTP